MGDIKRFQFSLFSAFGFMLALTVGIAFATQWIAVGAQLAIERLLEIVWLSSFVLAFWKSRQRSWRRVWEVTTITGMAWACGVFATHVMVVNSMQVYGFGVGGLLLRAALVSAIGVAAACLGATSIELATRAGRYWGTASARFRILVTNLLIVTTLVGGVIWYQRRDQIWRPAITKMDEKRLPGVNTFRNEFLGVQTSPDGRFDADAEGTSLSVFRAGTEESVARFQANTETAIRYQRDIKASYTTFTFLSDSSALFAIRVTKDGGRSLVGWNTDDWAPKDLSALNERLNQTLDETSLLLLVDHRLVVLKFEPRENGTTNLSISMCDIDDDKWKVTQFASMSVQRTNLKTWNIGTGMPWKISESGRCLISNPGEFEPHCQWVFRQGAQRPLRLAGWSLGFMGSTEYLVLNGSERSLRLVWKVPYKVPYQEGDRPPFWDHLREKPHCRLSLIDCWTGQTVIQSDWWHGSTPRFNSSRTQVIAGNRDTLLVWEVPSNWAQTYRIQN